MAQVLLNILLETLRALQVVAPSVATVFDQGRSLQEIRDEAHRALARSRTKRLSETWEKDLEARLGRGEPAETDSPAGEAPSTPDNPFDEPG